MSTQLLEIHPPELKFAFEVKKQSSCAVHLANVSDQYVAFKVKTTSPKKYCVRPNIGIIKPKSACDFTVTMQAQKTAPSDMQCKDKFLIQSTIVPFGTNEDDITGLFAKDSANYIEENKLRVVLVSPPQYLVLLPLNGVSNQEPSFEIPVQKDKSPTGVENLRPPHNLDKGVEDVRNLTNSEEPRPAKVVESKELSPVKRMECSPAKDMEPSPVKDMEPSPVKDVEPSLVEIVEPRLVKIVEPSLVKDVGGKELKLTKEIEDLKAKLNMVDLKLIEAEFTISKLKEEGSTTIQVNTKLKQELAMLGRMSDKRRIQVGFPLLFVCMVAIISSALGYLLHP